MNSATLLLVDAGINLGLGLFLLIFPRGIVSLLGIPGSVSRFYPSILGAVLFGIGIALLIQRYEPRSGIAGLELDGAVAFNLCGGAALALWQIFGGLTISPLGYLVLRPLAVIPVDISGVELRAQLGTPGTGETA